jgi:Fis family transcriptional regulator
MQAAKHGKNIIIAATQAVAVPVAREMSLNAARLPVHEAARETSSQSALSECVSRSVRRYLADIGDTECSEGLHAMVLREVEGPMLREVMAFHDGNQSRAAAVLGINRATLRKKLSQHGLL